MLASVWWVFTRIGLAVLLLAIILLVVAFLPDAWGAAVAGAKGQLKSFDWKTVVTFVVAGLLALTLCHYLIANNLIWRFHEGFNVQFEKLRSFYGGMLDLALKHAYLTIVGFAIMVVLSCGLILFIGTDFFPTVDAGEMRLHVRNPPGTRIEETERIFGDVERQIRKDIPASQIETLIDNMGIPNSSINLSLSDETLDSSADGEILISLRRDMSRRKNISMP